MALTQCGIYTKELLCFIYRYCHKINQSAKFWDFLTLTNFVTTVKRKENSSLLKVNKKKFGRVTWKGCQQRLDCLAVGIS